MKPFAIWLVIVAVVFGGYALIASMLRETTQVYVVVDSSFQMELLQRKVTNELDRMDDREHAEFALATEKGLVHSWQAELDLGGTSFYAPCTFADIESAPEAADADERIVVTTAANQCAEELAALTDWEIVELTP